MKNTKKVVLMRHGEAISSFDNDKNRSLTDMGRLAVQEQALSFSEKNIIPELIVCSDAARTQETVASLCTVWPFDDPKIEVWPQLYHTDAFQVRDMLESLAKNVSTLLIVGHNPWISSLYSILTDRDLGFSPAQVAFIQSESEDWVEAANGPWRVF